MPYSAASVVEKPRMLMPALPSRSAISARRPLRFSRKTVSWVTFNAVTSCLAHGRAPKGEGAAVDVEDLGRDGGREAAVPGLLRERQHGAGGAEQDDVDGAHVAGLAAPAPSASSSSRRTPRSARRLSSSSGYASSPRSTLPGSDARASRRPACRVATAGRGPRRPSSSSVAKTTSAWCATGEYDVASEAHRRQHAAAALGHALDLARLDVEPVGHGRLGEHRGGQQDALAADADERDRGRAVHDSLPRSAAS